MNRHRRLVSLKWRLMWPLAVFTLIVSALFAFFAMVLVYTVEDKFIEAMLREEARQQQAHFSTYGAFAKPQREFVTLYRRIDAMPKEVREALRTAPAQREFFGESGRHYHLRAVDPRAPGASLDDERAWLLAEVSGELVVRPWRDAIVKWFVGWGVGALIVSLALAAWLARRASAPIEALATRVAKMSPDELSEPLIDHATGSAEVAKFAQAFDELTERTRAFIEREQRFTRDASHELRTPLSVLRMSIENLQSEATTPADVAASLATMHASVRSMEQSVASLLALAREKLTALGEVETAVLPVVEAWVVANEAWLTASAAVLHIQVAAHERMPLPTAALNVVIANLLSNAVAHGVRASPILVTCEDRILRVQNAAPKQRLTQNEPGSGTQDRRGLGLSIVRRTLERYGYELQFVAADEAVGATVQKQNVEQTRK